MNRLISITHSILNLLDENLEERVVFLDISKAFDKAWHKGLIYQLQQNGISSELLNILVDILHNRTGLYLMVIALNGLVLKQVYDKVQSCNVYLS